MHSNSTYWVEISLNIVRGFTIYEVRFTIYDVRSAINLILTKNVLITKHSPLEIEDSTIPKNQ